MKISISKNSYIIYASYFTEKKFEVLSFEEYFMKQVIKLLGKGGFGVVFQVQSSTDNKMYAAKLESYNFPRKVRV